MGAWSGVWSNFPDTLRPDTRPCPRRLDEDELPLYRGAKRRKFDHTPDHAPHSLPSPLNTSRAFLSTPDARPSLQSPIQSLRLRRTAREILDETDESEAEEDEDELPVRPHEYKRPVQLGRRLGRGRARVPRGRLPDRRPDEGGHLGHAGPHVSAVRGLRLRAGFRPQRAAQLRGLRRSPAHVGVATRPRARRPPLQHG